MFFGHWTSYLRIYKNLDISLVLEAFLRPGTLWIWSAELSCVENVVISLVLEALLSTGLGTMNFQNSKGVVFFIGFIDS